MLRLLGLVVVTATVAGCGTVDCDDQTFTCANEDRPRTLEYITETILRPNCANAQCHSALTQANTPGRSTTIHFDSIAGAQQSIADNFLVTPGDPEASLLFIVLTRDTQPDGTFPRMPYDEPLPTNQIALIHEWINEGADGVLP